MRKRLHGVRKNTPAETENRLIRSSQRDAIEMTDPTERPRPVRQFYRLLQTACHLSCRLLFHQFIKRDKSDQIVLDVDALC